MSRLKSDLIRANGHATSQFLRNEVERLSTEVIELMKQRDAARERLGERVLTIDRLGAKLAEANEIINAE